MNAHSSFSRTESPYILYVDFAGTSDRNANRDNPNTGYKRKRRRNPFRPSAATIDLTRIHKILYRNPQGFVIDEYAYRYDLNSCEPVCLPMADSDGIDQVLGKTTLRFMFRSWEPFDFDDFEFEVSADNTDGRLDLISIEYEGKELRPIHIK